MATPSTVATYALNNSQRDFDVTFDYLSQTFVQVSLIGTATQVLTLGSDFTFLSPTTIRTTLTYGPPTWSYIEVRRVTSTTERLVEFNDASILHANELNLSDLQVIHIAEEARNAATETIGVDNNGNLDARGRRIVNVADPVDLGDSVNIRWYQDQVDGTHADRVAAEAAKVAAQAARVASEAARDVSVSAANSTADSAAAASASASSASASATSASASSTTALQYRNEAESFKNTAGTSATNAGNSATAAAVSAAEAAASAASINDANLVHKTGNETVGGVKTFTSPVEVPPGVSSGDAVNKGQLDSKVGLTGNETIAGVKTFSSSPVLPGDAITALQAVPKQQLDAALGTPQATSLSGTQQTVSVPAGTNSIRFSVAGLSTNGTSPVQLRLGTSGGIVSTGYDGSVTAVSSSAVGTGALLSSGVTLDAAAAASSSYGGMIELTHMSGNLWSFFGIIGQSNATRTCQVSGTVQLPGELTQLRLTTAGGTNVFDAGSMATIFSK